MKRQREWGGDRSVFGLIIPPYSKENPRATPWERKSLRSDGRVKKRRGRRWMARQHCLMSLFTLGTHRRDRVQHTVHPSVLLFFVVVVCYEGVCHFRFFRFETFFHLSSFPEIHGGLLTGGVKITRISRSRQDRHHEISRRMAVVVAVERSTKW